MACPRSLFLPENNEDTLLYYVLKACYFTFISRNHLEFLFKCGVRQGSSFILFFPCGYPLIEKIYFFAVPPFYHKPGVCRNVGLFLDSILFHLFVIIINLNTR